MSGNTHVRFLGGKAAAMPPTYPIAQENKDLLGKFLYVYRERREHFNFIGKFEPTISLHYDEDTIIDIYQLN